MILRKMHSQKGISLVELMISITIGLILMTGVVQLFLSSRTTFSTQQALARVQESGRLAMEFLSQDIRMAGYLGCGSRVSTPTNTLADSTTLPFEFDVAIDGEDNVTTLSDPTDVVAGTDVLIVRGATGNSVNVVVNNDADTVFVEDTGVAASCDTGEESFSGLCENDILVISDCAKARVFQATDLTSSSGIVSIAHATGSNPGNQDATWGGGSDPDQNFSVDAEVIQAKTSVYYIRNGSTSGQPGLWVQVNGGVAQELLEGVEDMQLTYRENSDPNNYKTAAAITDWSQVSSVRVQLLVQSTEDNLLQEAQPYTFNGTPNAAPGDRRLRQVFTSTVGIRSRLP